MASNLVYLVRFRLRMRHWPWPQHVIFFKQNPLNPLMIYATLNLMGWKMLRGREGVKLLITCLTNEISKFFLMVPIQQVTIKIFRNWCTGGGMFWNILEIMSDDHFTSFPFGFHGHSTSVNSNVWPSQFGGATWWSLNVNAIRHTTSYKCSTYQIYWNGLVVVIIKQIENITLYQNSLFHYDHAL